MSTLFAQKYPKIKKTAVSGHSYLEKIALVDNAPKSVYYLGELPLARIPTVAIVGTRKPTAYGREVTSRIASALARRGVIIVSGLALGTDAIAHQAALEAGGITIAVQANGLHAINPRSNRLLGERIVTSGGAIISEYEPGIEPLKHQFLERNRLISGLSDVVIVTEAASRSGSLNTAAHGLEQGTDVYAVPGNITSPMSAGCNHLIESGARPIVDIDVFIEEFLPKSEETTAQTILPLGSTKLENTIISLMSEGVRDGDTLLARSHASAAEFSTAITMLEINGIIKPLGANKWQLA